MSRYCLYVHVMAPLVILITSQNIHLMYRSAPGLHWVLPTICGQRKLVNQLQVHGHPGLNDAHREQRLVQLVCFHRRATVATIAKTKAVGHDTKVSCIWGYKAADRSECQC